MSHHFDLHPDARARMEMLAALGEEQGRRSSFSVEGASVEQGSRERGEPARTEVETLLVAR